MSLRLVSEETIQSWTNIETSVEDELPPPVPLEARMSWLQSIAIPKSELPARTKEVAVEAPRPAPQQRNVWEGLPMPAPRTQQTQRPGLPYAPQYRFIYARFPSRCHGCEDTIDMGDLILWYKQRKTVYCGECDEFRAANAERMANGLPDIRRNSHV